MTKLIMHKNNLNSFSAIKNSSVTGCIFFFSRIKWIIFVVMNLYYVWVCWFLFKGRDCNTNTYFAVGELNYRTFILFLFTFSKLISAVLASFFINSTNYPLIYKWNFIF